MLPTEMFSGDATPPVRWTPMVWTEGPDMLVKQAQIQLFQDRADIEHDVLNGGDRALSGADTANQNETEQVIDGSTPGDTPSGPAIGSRAAQWQNNLKDLRRDEPLAAWASGAHDGSANPPA